MAEAMAEVRMSWLYTCISSWPSTPRSSRALRMQDALGTADGRVPFVAPGGEGVRAHGGGDVDARHRLAGLGAQFTHNLVDLPGLPAR